MPTAAPLLVAPFLALIATLFVSAAPAPSAAQDTGWVIERFESRYVIQPDGRVVVTEAIDVDFRFLSRRGIFRDIDDLFAYDEENIRQYAIGTPAVSDAAGQPWRVRVEREGSATRFRIGDPDVTISGRQAYRIQYDIGGALNGFPDHDELYWNATGVWPVPIQKTIIRVAGPPGAIERVDCFQGPLGATEPCGATFTPDEAVFTATRTLGPGEQMSIVTGLKKGAVAEPVPILVARPRQVFGGGRSMFEATPTNMTLSIAGLVAAIGGSIALWWRVGRDRRYISMRHLTGSTSEKEERVPLFGDRPLGVEFEPPDRIRPGQMGLLVDERADTLDVTATIIDLAVRGYLRITELEKMWFLGKKDWQLDKLKDADDKLLDYERTVLSGLFNGRDAKKLSDLKEKFYKHLSKAKEELYRDAVDRGWFLRNPSSVRQASRLTGIIIAVAGVAITIAAGQTWGAGLVALPVVIFGVLLVGVAGAMPRRTSKGREVLQRALGFEKYIRTAEVRQQDYAERANIFTAYLPYAIAFRCVEKWANAFKDIDLQAATAGWYVGTGPFGVGDFSSNLGSFSSSVGTALASSPGGSGGSGFSGGGSSGGGGGGGGGGSW